MRQKPSGSVGSKSLTKIAAELASETDFQKQAEYPPDNWETTLVSCGSNAFGQLHQVSAQGSGMGMGGDLMSTLLKSTILPLPVDGSLRVDSLACGTNLSAAIVSHDSDLGLDYRKSVCYIWGAGLPGPSLRVPTPLSVRGVKQVRDRDCVWDRVRNRVRDRVRETLFDAYFL
jgi:hypothetical protein